MFSHGHGQVVRAAQPTDLKIRLDRASIVQKLKPAKFGGGHIGRTQNTEIPTRPNQTETFLKSVIMYTMLMSVKVTHQ